MFYFLMENQPSTVIHSDKNSVVLPSLATVQLVEVNNFNQDDKELITVFLSRFDAFIYLYLQQIFDEFKIVNVNDMAMDYYRDLCREDRKIKMKDGLSTWKCKMVCGFEKDDDACYPLWFRQDFSLSDLLLETSKTMDTIKQYAAEDYKHSLELEKLTDDEIVSKAYEFLGKDKFTSSTKRKEFFTGYFPQPSGKSYLFSLQDKKGLHVLNTGEEHAIVLFVNKLDAMIFALMQKEIDRSEYEPAIVRDYSEIDHIIKKTGVRLLVCYGFMATKNKLQVYWARTHDEMKAPAMELRSYTLPEVVNGFDLKDYFIYLDGEAERETAMTALMKTNFAPGEILARTAKSMYENMKSNLITQADENQLYHRLIFYGE